MKKKVLYVAAVLAALIFIWLGKEDSKPLVLKGTDLNQTAGISDYTGLIAIDESAAYYGMFAYTDDYVLNKGTYTIRPEYSNTSSDNIIEVGQRNEGGPMESGKHGWSEDCQRLYLYSG